MDSWVQGRMADSSPTQINQKQQEDSGPHRPVSFRLGISGPESEKDPNGISQAYQKEDKAVPFQCPCCLIADGKQDDGSDAYKINLPKGQDSR